MGTYILSYENVNLSSALQQRWSSRNRVVTNSCSFNEPYCAAYIHVLAYNIVGFPRSAVKVHQLRSWIMKICEL